MYAYMSNWYSYTNLRLHCPYRVTERSTNQLLARLTRMACKVTNDWRTVSFLFLTLASGVLIVPAHYVH